MFNIEFIRWKSLMFVSYLWNEQKHFCPSQATRRINIVKDQEWYDSEASDFCNQNNYIPSCPMLFVPFQKLKGMKQIKVG